VKLIRELRAENARLRALLSDATVLLIFVLLNVCAHIARCDMETLLYFSSFLTSVDAFDAFLKIKKNLNWPFSFEFSTVFLKYFLRSFDCYSYLYFLHSISTCYVH